VVASASSTLYTFTTTCIDPEGVLPPGGALPKQVGIVVPTSTAQQHMDTTYIYFHGSDQPLPTVAKICNSSGDKGYHICDAAASLGAPIIIPIVQVKDSSKKTTRTTKEAFNCVIKEATDVMAAQTPAVTLVTNYIVAGHSGGAFTMSSYFAAGLSAQKAIVFDGCYIGGTNDEYNFCEDILRDFSSGPVDLYAQAGSEGTGKESQKVKDAFSSRVTLKIVNLTHYQIPSACLKDLATCGGKVPDGSSGGTTGGSSATKVPTLSANNLPITKVSLVNPIGSEGGSAVGVTDFRLILGNGIRILLTIIGAIALVAFIVGGAYWLLSAGSPERVKKGTETMVWAAIGLFVVFSAYGILSAVIGGLTGRAPIDTGPVSTQGAEVQSGAYYQVHSIEVSIFPEPKPYLSARGTIGANVPCVLSPGGQKDGYVNVVDPKNPALTGWVLADQVSAMTDTEVLKAKCGSPSASAISAHCVCTVTDDKKGDTSQTAIPNVNSSSECIATSLQSPISGTSISDCSWQTGN